MMSTSDSEITAMEDRHVVEEDKSLLSAPPAFVPSSSPSFIATTGPDLTTGTVSILESKAISMANNDCCSTMSSPAEASPAKPAGTSTSVFEDTFDQSPAISHMASASDSLKCSEMSSLNIADFLPWSSALSTTLWGPELKDFPAVLTFKGVSVTLENNNIWKQFSECGTEMILTKNGRRMFPYCRYRLSGLDPDRLYSLVLSIVPSGQFKYRWATSKWEVSGATEHQNQGLIRAFSHHFSPSRGSEWMNSLVSFYKLKLTNNFQDQDGHITLHSMHRYIPRLHIIPVPEDDVPTAEKPVVIGPESMTFTFPQTEFMAVTTYQNFRITQLKINHNPFAKGFREDGHNPRLYRFSTPVMNVDIQPEDLNPAEPSEQEVMESSTASVNASLSSTTPETRLVLQPIMSDLSVRGVSYVPCIRGKQALVSTRPYHKKRRKKVKRRWGINCQPRMWKAAATADSTAAASPTVVPSPSLTVAMQPELDDIEGLLFASFTTKEALEFHIRDKPATVSSKESPVSSTRPTDSQEIMEAKPETVEEKMSQLESLLLNDLSVLKHRQAIHPVLQEVGLKLSSLDPTMTIDLNYLGVCLPLQSSAAPSSADEGLPFISRTGKTSDMTKIKGWRNKFTKSHETSASNCDESPKNLSAFCSNMLDEYLESEAQQISDRAAAFSLNPENSVSYQLPAKSSSYVKTLDSVLRHRNATSKIPERPSRPCPLSRKPLFYSSLRSQASHLSSPKPQSPAEPQSRSSFTLPDSSSGCSYSSYTSQRLLTNQAGICNTSAQRLGQDQLWTKNASNLNNQFKLSFLEIGALNQGLGRTQLTPERLTTALSAVLTNKTPPHQLLNSPLLPPADGGPECGQEFCRLGCVCSSLQHREKEPVHCRRPECMLDCTCSNTMTNTEPTAQSHLGFSATKLLKLNICDPDPESLNVPKSQKSLVPAQVQKRCASNPPPLIREEDKDPVYRYLESKMTCARVRPVNSQPPPVLTLESELSAANLGTKDATNPLNLSHNVSKNRPALISSKAEGQCSQKSTFNEKETRKQIQIRSLCQWKRDRKMVLEGLCERMNRNRLCQRFFIGPYCIIPVSKVTLQKPSGSLITYRVQISKPTHVSDCEAEDNSEYDYNSDESVDAEEEDELVEDPELWYGVTPFLRGAVPAGSLSARKKPIGYKASGLVEVNGKHYNYARLAIGDIGSLHPANRLAAHVTGRLPGPSMLSQTGSQNQGSAIKTDAAGSVPAKAASTGVPPAGTEKTQKTTLQPAVEMLQTLKASGLSGQAQNFLNPLYPVQLSVPVQHDFQNSSTSLSSSLSVSQTLKNPPFLGQSGTYSFRICPPSNQTVGGQKPPGVVLPGGFTLIELPKSKAKEAIQEAKPPPATETGSTAQKKEAASNLSHLTKEWVGCKAGKLMSSSPKPGSSSGPISDEKVPTGENSEVDSRQTPSQDSFDLSSEELSSDFSVGEEFDDETVDVETVEEGKERKLIAKMKEAALKNPRNTRASTNDSGSSKEPGSLAENKSLLNWRWNHKTLEKQRRIEQKALLNKLQKILRNPYRTSLNHLLSMAIKEIQVLTKTSKCLKEEKAKLIKEQAVYVHKLSVASGKYKVLIQKKLKEICERQKQQEKDMKWKPVFSEMLQTKAALLQATAPTSHLQPPPLHQQDYEPPARVQQLTTAQKKLLMLLALLHPDKSVDRDSGQVSGQQCSSLAASLSGQAGIVPPSQTGSRHGEPPSTKSQEQCSSLTASLSGQAGTVPPSQMGSQHGEPPSTKSQEQCSSLAVSLSGQAGIVPPSQKGSQHGEPPSTKSQEQCSSLAASLLGQAGIVPPSQTGSQHGEPPSTKSREASGDADPATLPRCLTNNQAPRTQNGPVSRSSAARMIAPRLLASVPLIRSKTGRLILPSSLKPTGQRFYTLMMMDSKQKVEEGEASSSANVQPSDRDLSKSLESNVFPPDQPSDVENKAGTSDSNPRPPGGTSPLGELDLHSQSVVVPSLDVNASETKQGLDLGRSQPAAAAHLCLNQASHLPPPPDAFKPDSSPPVGCCRSSGSMEIKSPPVGAGKQKETNNSVIYFTIPPLLVESKHDGLTVGTGNVEVRDSPNKASDDAGCPAPAKRGRGRPRKKVRVNSQTSSAKRASSDDNSPVQFSTCSFNSTKSEGETYTSRPQTRGSLGKDFPSAKKRSWIDVEKELEPDMEYA